MTHAEQYSTSEPSAPPAPRKLPRKRVFTVLALATSIGVTSAVISTARPAAADQLSDAKAEAVSVTAKLQSIQSQEQSLTGQVQSADYQLSQLQDTDRRQRGAGGQGPGRGRQGPGPAPDPGHQRLHEQRYQQSGHPDVLLGPQHHRYPIRVLLHRHGQRDHHHRQSAHGPDPAAGHPGRPPAAAVHRDQHAQQPAAVQGPGRPVGRPVPADTERCERSDPDHRAAAAGRRGRRRGRRRQGRLQRQVGHGPEGPDHRPDRGPDDQPQDGELGRLAAATAVSTAPPPPVPAGVGGAIQAAESQLHVPYVWGGETPGVGFDCSGLVQWSFAQAGISLPRTSGAQYAATTHISAGRHATR